MITIPLEVSEARFFDGTNVYKVNAENNNFNTDLKQKKTNTLL